MYTLNSHLKKFCMTSAFLLKSKGNGFFLGAFYLAASKVLQTIAFFLPIKVLIMLSSDNMPSYMQIITEYLSYEKFLIFLIGMVPILYLMYLICGILSRQKIDDNLKLYENRKYKIREEYVVSFVSFKKIHNHISKAFSEVLVFGITSCILFLLNPLLAILVCVACVINIKLFIKKAFYIHDDERISFLKLHKRQFIEYIASSNYLVVFAFLVLQMYFSPDDVYGVILALLLSRQLFQALQRFSIENIYISKL